MPIWYEALAHFEIYRVLKNKFTEGFEYCGMSFTDVVPEFKINNKSADLVIFEGNKNPIAVIEVKRGKQNIDPASNKIVHNQAKRYAAAIKAPYYILTDGERISCYRLNTGEMIAAEGLITRKVKPGTRLEQRKPKIILQSWVEILKDLVSDYQNEK